MSPCYQKSTEFDTCFYLQFHAYRSACPTSELRQSLAPSKDVEVGHLLDEAIGQLSFQCRRLVLNFFALSKFFRSMKNLDSISLVLYVGSDLIRNDEIVLPMCFSTH